MTKLSSRDEALQVIETFDSLPAKRKIEIFRDLSPEAREELVQIASRPWEIVRAVSEEEIYFTIKALGRERAPALIAMTTGAQLRHLIDMDVWRHDVFIPKEASEWIGIIAAIGEEKILQFLQVSDPELIVMMLTCLIRVSVRNPDIDHLEEQDEFPWFTLDSIFFIEFLGALPEDLLKQFLGTIFRWNPEYYYTLVQQMVAGIDPTVAERALKWAQSRLADKGFPDFEEALEIYRPVKRETIIRGSLDHYYADDENEERPGKLLVYPLTTLDKKTLFKRGLDLVDDQDERHRLSVELAHLANKVMIADVKDPASIDELLGSVKKVSGYINIALEEIAGSDLRRAVRIIKANHMEILFRRAYTLILELQSMTRKFAKQSTGGVENLGYPLAMIIKGVLRKRPVFVEDMSQGPKAREFETLTDIQTIKLLIAKKAFEQNWVGL
jgi:hypothetical protein